MQHRFHSDGHVSLALFAYHLIIIKQENNEWNIVKD